MAWLVSAVGALLVAGALRDIFHTLWFPLGNGALNQLVMRMAWRVSKSVGRRGMELAGPLAVLGVVLAWTGAVVLGWALVYLPHLPEGFSYAAGLDPARRSVVLDALYLSLVTVATLGSATSCPSRAGCGPPRPWPGSWALPC